MHLCTYLNDCAKLGCAKHGATRPEFPGGAKRGCTSAGAPRSHMAAGDSRGCDEFRGLLNGHGLIKELLGSRAYVTSTAGPEITCVCVACPNGAAKHALRPSTAGPETPLVHASAHLFVHSLRISVVRSGAPEPLLKQNAFEPGTR